MSRFSYSRVCRRSDFDGQAFRSMADLMGEDLERIHRKAWEKVLCASFFDSSGLLEKGSRGLVFGVGRESLPAFFVSKGCFILATDYTGGDEAWAETNQLCASVTDLHYQKFCNVEAMTQNVEFRDVNMNDIPDDLSEFDFVWSLCAAEHLGTIQAGLRFITRSMRCLKPSGSFFHTLEFNLSSNDDTIDSGTTVFFRRRDMEIMADIMRVEGHDVCPLDFGTGDHPDDWAVVNAVREKSPEIHLKLLNPAGYIHTCMSIAGRRCP